MMELTCAFILIFASLVSATPFGYGVKGGASARAESSASAGAFGGVGEIPVAVPLGTGFSGTFSKSSSSSSSSSSASSSSSSSLFSYNGSGAGGLSGFGLDSGIQGNAGCTSGNCQNAGANGIPTSHGSSIQGYNSANAVATAGAGAVSGSGCQGLSCDGDSEKCASGQCNLKTQTGSASIDSDSKTCTSGQCGSTQQSGPSPVEYGSNDIRVVTGNSGSTHNLKYHSSDADKTPSAHNSPDSDCSQGKCGPSGPSSSKPSYGNDSGNSYHDASNKQQSSDANSDAGITSNYQKPSTHLETPKLPLEGPGHETLPSNYNVPIQDSYNNGKEKPTCDGVKCENQPKAYTSSNGNSLSTNYLNTQLSTENFISKELSSTHNPSTANCRGSNCIGIPSSHITGGPSLTVAPGNIQFGQSSSNAPSLNSINCKTPNCSPYPTNLGVTAESNVSPGNIGYTKPSDGINSSIEKLPVYTGGFGGPNGVLKPNEFGIAAPTSNPIHVHASTTHAGAPLDSTTTGCNSPSCSGYLSATGANAQSTYGHKPGGGVSTTNEKLPTYTGGFGGPAGMLKPNEFDVHATITNEPSYAYPAGSSHNTQTPSDNIGTPGCKTGNCGGYSSTAGATSGASATSGYFGTTKPSIGISSSGQKLPAYTGGFGGPGGLFKPNEYDTHVTGSTSSSHTSSGTYNTPTSSSNSGGCKTPNCSPSDVGNSPGLTPSGTYNSPASGSNSGGCKTPNCSPSDVGNSPGYTPSGTYNSPASSGNSGGCKTPNCAPLNVGSSPGYTPSVTYNSPASGSNSGGCKTPNCSPSDVGNSPGYTPSGTYHSPASSSNSGGCKTPSCSPSDVGNSPGYTPSGTYNSPASSGNSGGCKTPNCAPLNVGSSHGYTPSVTYNSPASGSNSGGCKTPNCSPSDVGNSPGYTPSGTYNSPTIDNLGGCKTPNCNPSTAAANAQAESFGVTKPSSGLHISSVTLPAYTSGYNKPSGANRPNEISAPALTPSHTNIHSPSYPGSYSTGCETGNCGIYPTSGASTVANAQPGSFGTTKPNTDSHPSGPTLPQYTGSFGGPSGTLKPNEQTYVTPSASHCKTPNCANSPTAGAGVVSGAISQSGSFAITKPSGGVNSNEKLPAYTGGFGGSAGLLKPNEYTVPAVSPALHDYNKPLAPTGVSKPAACTSGNCNPHVPHGSASDSHNAASHGVHATAAAAADTNAVAYTGGFGGPPGFLKPYDDGKIGVPQQNGGQAHGPQIGAHYSSPNANIHFAHGTAPGAVSGTTGPAGSSGAYENTGVQAGSISGSAAYAGSETGASSGAHGYNTHGSHYNHAGNIGGSPCGGGCGGTTGSAYNAASSFDSNGGHGFSKLGYSDGLNGGRIAAGATAKSLAGASAFGVGGGFASSSASAHSSAGAYTKGGYGKR